MHRVSSNLTIFFKVFLPTVWIVFFTSILITIFTISDQTLPAITTTGFKIGFIVFYLSMLLIIYFSIFQLKRVEFGEDSYIVTNYLKTYRLIYDDIEQIDLNPMGRVILIKFKLRANSSFGKKITFLASKQLYDIFMSTHLNVENKFKPLIKGAQ